MKTLKIHYKIYDSNDELECEDDLENIELSDTIEQIIELGSVVDNGIITKLEHVGTRPRDRNG